MIPMLRWLPGVVLIALLAATVIILMTEHSRQRTADLRDEATKLAHDEAALMASLAELRSGSIQVIGFEREDIWRADGSGSVEVRVQQALVAAAKRAELTVASFGSGPARGDTRLPTLSYGLELSGTHEGVARLLADLERQRPALAISYLWLRQMPVNQSKPGSPVQMRISVWGFLEPVSP